MNTYLKLFGMLLTAFTVNAQNNYTLQQCIDYALQNQTSYQNATLDEEIAKAKVGEIRGIGLPQVTASANLLDNIVVQKAFVPEDAFNPMGDPNKVLPLGFGIKYSSSVSLALSQIIFDGSYLVGLQSTKTFLALSQKNKEASKASIIQNVKKAYLGVLVAQERMKLLDINISRLDSTFNQLVSTNKAGFVEKLDVDRLEVQLNNLKVEKQNVQNLYEFGLLALKFQMGMQLKEPLAPVESLDQYKAEIVDLSGDISYDNRPEYALLKVQKKANELELKNHRYKRLPSLVAFGNLGANNGAVNFGDLYSTSWYNFSNIGLNLSMPIFSGTQRQYQISAAKLNIRKTENNIKNLQNVIDFQAANARVNFKNNKQTLDIQEKNMALAKSVLDVAQKKYQAGVGSNLEVTNAEAEYKTAVVNYYGTLFDALSAKVDYDYAVGNLK